MKFLIISLPGDVHALSVQNVLKSRGHEVLYISWSDFPQIVSVSTKLGGVEKGIIIKHKKKEVRIEDFDVIWNHRTLSAVPDPSISSSDKQAIELSSRILLQGVLSSLDDETFVVNSPRSKWLYDNKVYQLKTLKNCGFNIPKTLISNDIEDIKEFLQSNKKSILKPLKFMRWDSGKADATLYTTRIDNVDSYNPLAITSCPMIYQEAIDKLHELRIFVLGREIMTFKINSQNNKLATLDWRVPSFLDLEIECIKTPIEIEEKILSFMKHTGFVYGSFDFAVTPEGEHICFEFNETGQFLWLEQLCPETQLLDRFCTFLTSKNSDFVYKDNKSGLDLNKVFEDIKLDHKNMFEKHVSVDMDKRFKETCK